MKKLRYTLPCLLILISAFLISCDDSGVIHNTGVRGSIFLLPTNLPHLNETVDGYYQLWIRIDSSGVNTYYSCGKFNMSYNGTVTDTAGGQMTFHFSGDTNKLDRATVGLITVEPYGVNNSSPGPTRLISTSLTQSSFGDSIYGTMTVSGAEAMGSFANIFLSGQGQDAIFSLMTPTASLSTCFEGLWFCYPNGNAGFPQGMDLPPSFPWVYEGWVADTITNPSNPVYYSMGRFTNPYHADWDSAGPCRGPNSGIDKPGQDWITDNCPPGKPKITDLHNGHYAVMVTLEPANEQPGSAAYGSPFPLRLFGLQKITSSCIQATVFYNRWVYVPPRAFLRILL